MARGHLGHNLALRDLGGHLPCGPLADGASRLGRRFAGQRHALADLLVRHAHGLAGPRRLREARCDLEVVQGDRLSPQPPGAPEAHRIERYAFLAGNLAIVGTLGRSKHHACPQGDLRRGAMAPHERCSGVPFCR
jgi:hypothetical protein